MEVWIKPQMEIQAEKTDSRQTNTNRPMDTKIHKQAERWNYKTGELTAVQKYNEKL